MTKYKNMYVAPRATGLLDLVSAAVNDINRGNHSDVERKLVAIKEDSHSVILQSENRMQRLSEQENTVKREEEELQDEIGRLESLMQETGKSLALLEARKSCMQDELEEENKNLIRAQKEYDEARNSQKERETGAKVGVVATVALAIIAPPTLAVTIPTLAGLGALVINAEDRVRSAQRKVQDKKSSISSLEHDISVQKSSIQGHRLNISKLKSDHQVVMKQRGDLRRTIVFIQQAINFFNFLTSATEAGNRKTDLLHKIVSKLHEKQEFTIRSSRGIQTVARSFRDAWNQVEQLIDSGEGLEFLSIEFSDEYMMRLSTA